MEKGGGRVLVHGHGGVPPESTKLGLVFEKRPEISILRYWREVGKRLSHYGSDCATNFRRQSGECIFGPEWMASWHSGRKLLLSGWQSPRRESFMGDRTKLNEKSLFIVRGGRCGLTE